VKSAWCTLNIREEDTQNTPQLWRFIYRPDPGIHQFGLPKYFKILNFRSRPFFLQHSLLAAMEGVAQQAMQPSAPAAANMPVATAESAASANDNVCAASPSAQAQKALLYPHAAGIYSRNDITACKQEGLQNFIKKGFKAEYQAWLRSTGVNNLVWNKPFLIDFLVSKKLPMAQYTLPDTVRSNSGPSAIVKNKIDVARTTTVQQQFHTDAGKGSVYLATAYTIAHF
jgi:hypothetical protein